MKNIFHYACYFFVLSFCLLNTTLALEPADTVDMWDEPRHQLVFSRDHIRLLMVNIPTADTSLLHKHEFATSYVVLEDTLTTDRRVGAEWRTVEHRKMRKMGTVIDRSDYFVKPFSHQVRNIGANTLRVFALVNTRKGTYRNGESESAEDGQLLENDWFRERRLELDPGEVSDELVFNHPLVAIQVSDGISDVLNQHSRKTMPGSWSFHDAGQAFRLHNSGDRRVKLLLIEMK